MSDNLYAQGAYNDVPFKITYNESSRFDWGHVDPREWDQEAAFLLFKNHRDDDSLLRELPDKYVEDCQSPLVDLCRKHKEKVAAKLESLQEDGNDIFLDGEYSEEDLEDPAQRLEMADGLICEMCQSENLDVMLDMLTFCKIPHRVGTISDEQHSYQYLYYRTDGEAIRDKIEEKFNNCYDDVKNFLDGNLFDVEIPGECFEANLTNHFSSVTANHPLANLIREQIDALRTNKKGKYKIVASRATESGDEIHYVKDDNIELFAPDKATATRMVDFYKGHALALENEAPTQGR